MNGVNNKLCLFKNKLFRKEYLVSLLRGSLLDTMKYYILAIETSCDETASAVISVNSEQQTVSNRICSNVVASQVKLHAKYGGVYPELASREHLVKILPVIELGLKRAGKTLDEITHLAVTTGPGLIGSLLVGVETAKALAMAKNLPIIPINHLAGHIYAALINNESQLNHYKSQPFGRNHFPALALLVSGGHTLLALIKNPGQYKIIGETRDDAAGEAFDKVARLLGLGYPGGPVIEKAAKKGRPGKFSFPVAMEKSEGLDFSFSGLKTAVLYEVKKLKKIDSQTKNELAFAFQKAAVEHLVQKAVLAVRKYQPKTFILSGGVAANSCLRQELKSKIKSQKSKIEFLVPPIPLCTDNAVGIGLAAAHKLKKGVKNWYDIEANANQRLA
jgi:N6-L-threonylcarbamoyladenine synthase